MSMLNDASYNLARVSGWLIKAEKAEELFEKKKSIMTIIARICGFVHLDSGGT